MRIFKIRTKQPSTIALRRAMLASGSELWLPMKTLQIVPSDRIRLYGAMVKKQAEIRRSGRGTFSRAGARGRNGVKWTHVRYKGSINLEQGASEAVEAVIRSPDRGDEARLLSSFLGWLDRHFGEHLAAVTINYRRGA